MLVAWNDTTLDRNNWFGKPATFLFMSEMFWIVSSFSKYSLHLEEGDHYSFHAAKLESKALFYLLFIGMLLMRINVIWTADQKGYWCKIGVASTQIHIHVLQNLNQLPRTDFMASFKAVGKWVLPKYMFHS